MVHGPVKDAHEAVAHISYTEVTFAGQAFRLGRYPIHFHLNGDMSTSYIRGCAIWETFNRAINIHGTQNTLVERNVIYNVMGGALFLEDGIETGNTFQYNLAVFVKASTSLLNDDITPAAYWITNPNNTYQHNVAAGGTHFGFWYRMHDHPDGPSYTSDICPRKVPLGKFFNNTVHSQGWFGLWMFQDYYPMEDGACDSTTPKAAKFGSMFVWNCEKGAEVVNAGSLQFHDMILVNNEKAGFEWKTTIFFEAFSKENGPLIKNSHFISHSDIISPSKGTNIGMILPFHTGLILDGVTFHNFDQTDKTCFGVTIIDGTCNDLCGGWHYHVYAAKFHNSPNIARWRWNSDGILHDKDGSLTGKADSKVLPTVAILPTNKCAVNSSFSIGKSGSVCDPSVR